MRVPLVRMPYRIPASMQPSTISNRSGLVKASPPVRHTLMTESPPRREMTRSQSCVERSSRQFISSA